MIAPEPFKLQCPKCGYSKVVVLKSDVLDVSDLMRNCPKCDTLMEETTLSTLEKLKSKIFK